MSESEHTSAQISAGGVTVTVPAGPVLEACDRALGPLVADDVVSRLAAKDATLWGPDARASAERRLGWLDVTEVSPALLPRLAGLRAELAAEGVDRVVLCGMGGSSLAPEVITAAAGLPLTVVDTTDAGQVRAALAGDLTRTVLVVSSKSGGTVETDSQRRAFTEAFREAGIDAASRTVVVTDPDSPLARLAESEKVRALFLADPDVGGRYSALTAFGLVPSALAGVDVAALLAEAAAVRPTLASETHNPAVALGAALGGAAAAGRDKLVIAPGDAALPGFADWAEQLVAESTGKQGSGLLPVVVDAASEVADADDTLRVQVGGSPDPSAVTVAGPLGAQLLVWEAAVAVAGRVLGIDPFDQPDVESAKTAARGMLEDRPEPTEPAFVEGAVEVRGDDALLAGVRTLAGALDALLGTLTDRGYLAVMAYLDRTADAAAAGLRVVLAARTGRPVTFGWAPRFLHSTGQFHKGGPPVGVFLQLTGTVTEDLAVPGRDFTFGELQASQAAGDAAVLAEHARPLLRLHLTDRASGLVQIREALG